MTTAQLAATARDVAGKPPAAPPAAAAAASAAPRRTSLASVQRGKKRQPDRILLVGVEGIGKTTFAASSDKPIFIAAEDGIGQLDVPSFPEPRSYDDVLGCVQELTTQPHDYRTLAIDTLDWTEPLVYASVCARENWSNIEKPGFGKGYVLAAEEWRKLMHALELMQVKTGMDVILLAHAAIKSFNNPAGDDYSRYECKLHRQSAALWREWCRANLFATHEEFVKKDAGERAAKATSTGNRIMHTERTAAWDAKNRYGLPPVLPLDWTEYAAARELCYSDPAVLQAEAMKLVDALAPPAEVRTVIEADIAGAADKPARMAMIVNRLRLRVSEKAES